MHDFPEEVKEDMFGGPLIAFTVKHMLVEETFVSSLNVCNSLVGKHVCLLYPIAMCQLMPRGLYIRWQTDTDIQQLKPRSIKARPDGKILKTFS